MGRKFSDKKEMRLLVGAKAENSNAIYATTSPNFVPSPENADAVLRALHRFGTPLHALTREDLQKDDTVFQIGVAPRRIDIVTSASGL
jgi:hypothetical protein